jgi:hypothetical protein
MIEDWGLFDAVECGAVGATQVANGQRGTRSCDLQVMPGDVITVEHNIRTGIPSQHGSILTNAKRAWSA